jgi:hypothetical protein
MPYAVCRMPNVLTILLHVLLLARSARAFISVELLLAHTEGRWRH